MLFKKILAVLVIIFLTPIAVECKETKKALIIHSYHQGFGRTDKIQEGLLNIFEQSKYNVEMFVEYLDTKRYKYDEIKNSLHSMLEYKHRGKEFDVVIATDDNAIDFSINHRLLNHIGIKTPIIFCGENREGPNTHKGVPNITGVIEHYDILKTIGLIKKLEPYITHIVIITDTNSEAVRDIEVLFNKKEEIETKEGVDLEWIHGWTPKELNIELRALPRTTAIIKTSLSIDKEGFYYSLEDSLKILKDSCPFNIYAMLAFEIIDGVVGGYVIDGYQEGQLTGSLAIKLFEGTPIKDIPVVDFDLNPIMVNYRSAIKLNMDNLPTGTILVNYPYSFYQKNMKMVWLIIIVLFIQLFIIVALIAQSMARKQAEKLLSFNTFVVEHAQDATFWINSEGRFTWVNSAATKYLGYDREELMGMCMWDIHFDDFNQSDWETHFESIKIKKHALIEHTHKSKNKKSIPVEVSANYVKFGEKEYVCAFARDISDRREVFKLIEQNELKYRLLVETTPYGIEELDLDGRVTYINSAFCKMMKMNQDEILGHYIWEFVHNDEKEKLKESILYLAEHETKPYRHRGKNITKGGRSFDVQVDWDYKRINDKIVGFIGVLTNVSDIVRYQKRQELSSAILDALNSSLDAETAIKRILGMIKEYTSFDAVAIRLQEDEDYPYYVTSGFHEDFVVSETNLCSRNEVGEIERKSDGTVCLDCMCGAIICGNVDPDLPFFTDGGSFWTNSTSDLINEPDAPKNLKEKARNRCNSMGYESVALIPLVSRSGINIGLLQLNDRRRDMLDMDIIKFFEGLGASIGIALGRKQSEELIRESEEKYRTLYATAPLAIIFWGIDCVIQEWNDQAQSIFGWTKEEVVGQNFLDFLVPDYNIEAVKNVVDNILNGKLPSNFINDNNTKSGKIITCEWNNTIVYDKDNVKGVVSLGQDITERYESDEALRQSEEKFRMSFETIPDAITIINTKGEFVDVNEGFIKLSGYSKEETIGRSVVNLGFWHGEKQREQFYKILNEKGSVTSFRTKLKDKSGRIGDALISSNFIDIQGEKHIISITKDITASVLAEQAIRDSEAVFRTAFETIPDAVAINDRSTGEYLHVNEGFLQLSGYSWADLKNKTSLEAGLWVKSEFRDRIISQLKSEGKLSNFEINFIKKSGEIRNGLMSAASIKLENRWCTLTITKDITERKIREEELLEKERQIRKASKMEAVGTLAGGVAHDFNNIIQIISGNVQLLLMESESESDFMKTKLDSIYSATVRGADLSRRLLTFSRNVESILQPTDVNAEIRLAHKLLDRSISGPVMINIDLDLDKNLSLAVADPAQLNQVITNLCINAKDAMPLGGHVLISTKNVELDEIYCQGFHDIQPGNYVRITVADEGEGMTQEIQERIFEPFFTTKEPGKGTGLGLAVVYGIIKNHHGHITVYSCPGKGTEFKVFLKVSEEKCNSLVIPEPLLVGGKETILVIDDEDAIRTIGIEILSKYGYKVLSACDGKEGLDIYQKNFSDINLVILDLIMPEISGTEVLMKIIEINPNAKVIVASGYSANGPVRDAISKGAKRFIDKPYTLRQLIESVRQVLDNEGDK
jgi:two-component system cell cycle sensor histidine kinase/response regulator CckA